MVIMVVMLTSTTSELSPGTSIDTMCLEEKMTSWSSALRKDARPPRRIMFIYNNKMYSKYRKNACEYIKYNRCLKGL